MAAFPAVSARSPAARLLSARPPAFAFVPSLSPFLSLFIPSTFFVDEADDDHPSSFYVYTRPGPGWTAAGAAGPSATELAPRRRRRHYSLAAVVEVDNERPRGAGR